MNIPKDLRNQMKDGNLQIPIVNPTKAEGWKPGIIVRVGREVFKLVERKKTYPTKDQWAHAEWQVNFPDRYGRYPENPTIEYLRPIVEVGVPNQHKPEKIISDDFWDRVAMARRENSGTDKEPQTDEQGRIIQRTGRGRPEGEMNELKARNIFRNTANGRLPYNDEKIKAAMDFLLDDKNEIKDGETFVEKYLKKIDLIAPSTL